MPANDFPTEWTDPEYVGAVVGVIAVGSLVFYSSLTKAGPTVEEIVFVVLTIALPATGAYEIARRWL